MLHLDHSHELVCEPIVGLLTPLRCRYMFKISYQIKHACISTLAILDSTRCRVLESTKVLDKISRAPSVFASNGWHVDIFLRKINK